MEGQVNVTKSALAQDQMPTEPPSYPGPPKYDSPEYHTNIVAVQPPIATPVIIASALGIEPVSMICSACNEHMVTRIERIVWLRTHVIAGLLCLIGCWPCAPIPYCTDVCKKAVHYCSKCNAYIGTQL